jgi:tRNA A37 N6-isopentenylltransferase MiaA
LKQLQSQTLQNPQHDAFCRSIVLAQDNLFLKPEKMNAASLLFSSVLEAERSVMYNQNNQRVNIMMNEGLMASKSLYANKV